MRTSTLKSIAAIALTGAGSAIVVGFQAPDTPVLATTTTQATGTTTAVASASPSTSSSATATSPAASTTTGTTSGGSSTATPATATASPSAATTEVAVATTFADGTWTGTAVSEPWGDFQVQVTVSGGRITAATVVQSPQDGHSSRINGQAVPMLTQATIAAQSASIDMVSGATWTSQSYVTSLQAALDQAQAAAQTAG